MRSKRLLQYVRPNLLRLEQVLSYQKFLEKKQMNCEDAVVMAENMVPLQDVPEEWDGLTV